MEGAEIIGIGLVESALGMARVLAQKPAAVLLVGSCGAYPGTGLAIGDVVLGTRFLLAAASGELGPIAKEARPPRLSREGRAVTVASTLSITTDDDAARSLVRQTNAHVENLEAFAAARACEREGIAFAALLGVTNVVGRSGRSEWRANAADVAARVIAAI